MTTATTTPFKDSVTIAEKTEKEGAKGTYYACRNEKNLVYNVSENVMNECGGRIKIGVTYLMEGVILSPKEGYTHGSRWVNKFHIQELAEKSPEQKPPGVAVQRTEYEAKQDGMKFGNRLTNATELVRAMIDAGKLTADLTAIEQSYDKIFEMFDRAEKSGKFERPF